jgi:hypothetical protein
VYHGCIGTLQKQFTNSSFSAIKCKQRPHANEKEISWYLKYFFSFFPRNKFGNVRIAQQFWRVRSVIDSSVSIRGCQRLMLSPKYRKKTDVL